MPKISNKTKPIIERLWPAGTEPVHYQAAVLSPQGSATLCVEAAKRLEQRRFDIKVYRIGSLEGTVSEIFSGTPPYSRIVAIGPKGELDRAIQRLRSRVGDFPLIALDNRRLSAELVMEACLRNLE